MDQSLSVARLILQARAQDQAAVERLLDAYRSYLRLLARAGIDRSLQGKADPSDLVQDAMLQAAQHFQTFRGQTEAELVAWLRKILLQALANLARRYQGASRQVDREVSLDRVLNQSSAALDAIGRNASDRSGSIPQGAVAGVLVANALGRLSEEDREVITLRNFERLDWSEVGARMDRSPEAARKLWGRAIQRLRPIIEAAL